MIRLRALVALILALGGLVPTAALADVPIVQSQYTFTATGASPWLYLSGQSYCSVVTSGTGTGLVIVPQSTSDTQANINAGTAAVVTAIGVGAGSITAQAATNTGSVAGVGLAGFRINVTAITGGTETAVLTCSPASAPPATVTFTADGLPVSQAVQMTASLTGAVSYTTGLGSRIFAYNRGSGLSQTGGPNLLGTLAFLSASNGATDDPVRKDSYTAGPLWTTIGGSTTASIASGAANTVVKATAGRLVRLTVSVVGSSALTCYDNATTNSGTVLGGVNATNAATLFFTQDFNVPATAGITCANTAGGPVVTASYY